MKRKSFLASLFGALFFPDEGIAMNITISVPGDGSALKGIVPVTVDARPIKNLQRIELYVDDKIVGTQTVSPAVFQWDTTNLPDTSYALFAKVYYKQRVSTATITVWTANQSIPLPKPSIPTGLTSVLVGSDVRLDWDDNPQGEQVDSYRVYMDDNDLALGVPTSNYVASGVPAGVHTFRVSAHNAAGQGQWTDPVSVTVPAVDDYTYRFATLNPATDKITGCLNRFQPSYSWWVPGSPEGTPWANGGGVHPISHPVYGPGLSRVTTKDMLYGNATAGPKDSNISRFAIEPRLVDSRLQYLAPKSLHTWECTIMRPPGFSWITGKQYEGVWAYSWTNNGFNTVGHHIYLNYNYHWPGFSYYFGYQYLEPTESPPQTVLWKRYNCPLPLNEGEYHTIRWEILHSDKGVPNGHIKCWTSVNGGPFTQWLNLTNVVTLLSGFSQNYFIYCTLRTPLNNPTMSLHQHNLRVKIA